MTKVFEFPVVEIVYFEFQDVIATSFVIEEADEITTQ